jgi:peptide-methionine (S)-S-oxide reductase
VVQTVAGYAGGTSVNPTYHDLDGHTETTQVRYIPTVISYERLLEIFWSGVDPTARISGRQYAQVIFFHDAEQQRQAEESKQRLEEKLKQKTSVEILPFKRFYAAEGYHQKYYLQQNSRLMHELKNAYPKMPDLLNSTAAARLNAFVSGNLTLEKLRSELGRTDLLQPAQDAILEIASGAVITPAHCSL